MYAYMGKLISGFTQCYSRRIIAYVTTPLRHAEELKSIFYFTVFLKQRQISSRHYTELLIANSRTCVASFAEITHFAPRFPKNQS